MDLSSRVLATLVLVPATVFATWCRIAMAKIEDDLREFEGHDRMDFEVAAGG